MKGGIAATIVWFSAAAFCFGQRTEPLDIKVFANKLEARATLYGTTWSRGEGTATVVSSDPYLKVQSPVNYTIQGDAKQKTLLAVIGYTAPSGAEPQSELTLTGVKDAKGGMAIVFKGQVLAFAAKPGAGGTPGTATGTAQTPVEQKAAPDVEVESGQGIKKTSAGQQTASVGLLPTNLHDWLLFGNTAILGLLLLSGAVFLVRRKGSPQQSDEVRRHATTNVAQPEVDFSLVIKQAKNDAERALTQAAEAKREALVAQEEGDEISKRLKHLQKEIATLRELRLEAVVAERKESLRWLAQALEELPQETAAANRSGMAEAQWEEAAAAAIVNRWLGDEGKDRNRLLSLAAELEIPAELRNHRDLTRVFDDLTTFEYPFAPDADGPWLWVPIAGTEDFWAAPADASFFGMGRAPSLLERLFEGMHNANQGFQFRTIYKPCRLRPVAGKDGLYTVVSKGLLRLEGAPAPAAPAPKDFGSLVPEKVSSMEPASLGSNPSKRLATWIRSTSRQLREQQKGIEWLSAQKTGPAIGELLSRREFKRHIDDVQRQLEVLHTKLRARAADSVAPESSATLLTEKKTKPVSASHPSDALGELPLRQEQEASAKISDTDETVTPKDWQEALRRAAQVPGSEPETTGVPSEEVYVQRARNLTAELRKLDPASGTALVHLKRNQVHETFEVHETEASSSNPGEVVCTACNAAHTWQLAVCMGARDGEIAILYPLGGMSKGKYLSGYTGLIADLPMTSFTIAEVEEPARLRPTAEGRGIYTVVRKMRLVSAVSGEAVRG